MRPLTAAVAAAGRGKFVLDGVARMRERPIQGPGLWAGAAGGGCQVHTGYWVPTCGRSTLRGYHQGG